jgi:toxin FitB
MNFSCLRLNPNSGYFEEFFQVAQVLPISQDVLIQAVALRQQRRMALGDAIIAGTALVYQLTLITRNVNDFRSIAELNLLNPFDPDPSDAV